MKISIFPEGKALPTKAEKGKEARFTSKPYSPKVVEISTNEDLVDIITKNCWSPFIFKEFRRASDFISVDFLVYDIDEGQTIEEVEKVIHNLDIHCLVLPTTSHTEEDHRFRVIIPLSKTVTDTESYNDTFAKMAEYFSIDPACSDVARFFFGSTTVDGFYFEGSKLLEPEKAPKKPKKRSVDPQNSRDNTFVAESTEELVTALYGEKRTKVPESIAYFLENAPDNLSGEWYKASNAFLFTCGLSGLDEDRVKEVFFSLYPHEELTEKKVDKMIQDGYDEREEEL